MGKQGIGERAESDQMCCKALILEKLINSLQEISNKEHPDGFEELQPTCLSGSTPKEATLEEQPQMAA